MSTKTKASSKNKKLSTKAPSKKVVAKKTTTKPVKKLIVKSKLTVKKSTPKKAIVKKVTKPVKKALLKKVVAKKVVKSSKKVALKKASKPIKKVIAKKTAVKKTTKPVAKKNVVKVKPPVKVKKNIAVKVSKIKPEKIVKEKVIKEKKVKKEKLPIIKKPIIAPTTFRKDTNDAPAKFVKEPNGKFEMEFVVRASEDMVFEFVSTESGLSEWFCDDVNIRDGIFTFNWEGQIQQAKLIKEIPPQLIRYQWLDKNDGSYFEFRTQKDDLTNDISLMITDFASDKADEISARLLWHSQIDKLLHVLGSFF